MDWRELDIDWTYLLERLERLLNLGEAALTAYLPEAGAEEADFSANLAFRWEGGAIVPVADPDLPDLAELVGLDDLLARLRANTAQFVSGFPANDVLLWGERGSGKSTAVRGLLREFGAQGLRLVELPREALPHLPAILATLRSQSQRFILFCDDLGFASDEHGDRPLKGLLEGSLERRPDNVRVYATSNRRHLLPEPLDENAGRGEIHPEEAIAERLALSDRFGITLAFEAVSQEHYLEIVRTLARRRRLRLTRARLEGEALRWAGLRGARSGRVARQFLDDLAGRLALARRSPR